MIEKKCFACGITKPLEEFYVHKMMGDGHLNKCKQCVREYMNRFRKENAEKVRERDRIRQQKPKRREKHREKSRRFCLEHADRRKIMQKVNNAVRDGRLAKTPCEKCGETKWVHGHHDDYSKPLDVHWLCAVHHKERHRELGWGFNQTTG